MGRAQRAAAQRQQARSEFLDEERFRQVVVGAEFQPGEAVAELGARRQQDNRRRDVLAAQRLEHRQTVATRQHDVEHDQVVPALFDQLEAAMAVLAVLDDETTLPQAGAHEFRDLLLVLHEENAQRRLVYSGYHGVP